MFAFHRYPSLIHRLTYRPTHHENLCVQGYIVAGTTPTPFTMVVLNELTFQNNDGFDWWPVPVT
ncbi:MAG: hypothetical protein R3B95_11135 [Nitrospirales bacterium]|nr:hypothetical protein [Nitrospira sp.]